VKQSFKTAYGKRDRVSYETKGASLTQQHFKDEVDIKKIIKKYDRTGIIQNVNKAVAQYGDFTASVNEYADALNLVVAAQQHFAQLPSEIRERFNNDPGTFLEQVGNPDNKEEMQQLGLVERDVAVEREVQAKDSAAEPPAPQKAGE
jgi:phage internal scaffolding protein